MASNGPRSLLSGLLGLALLCAPSLSPALGADQPDPPAGSPVVVTLHTGEALRGTLVQRTDGGVVLQHPHLGQLTIPPDAVSSVSLDPNAPAVETDAERPPEPAPPGAVTDPAATEIVPERLSIFEGWTGSFDLGLFGSQGNTERLSLRTGIGMKRVTDETSATVDARYFYSKESGDVIDNKARIDLRNDWLPDEGSRWRPFVLGTFEYDEFQDWNIRLAAFVGMGYEFVKTEETLFMGRVGVGASKEIGGGENAIRPEGLLGLDLEHRINDRQRLTGTVDFFPDFDDFGEFRANAKAAWEILLDPDSKITLKIGVEDRYDSTPGDADHNDLDFFAVIVIPF